MSVCMRRYAISVCVCVCVCVCVYICVRSRFGLPMMVEIGLMHDEIWRSTKYVYKV